MAYLVQVSSIWEDILSQLYRSRHLSAAPYARGYEAFHAAIRSRLADWLHGLPPSLTFAPANVAASIEGDYCGTFITLCSLYHVSHMMLNRRVRHAHLSATARRRNLHAAVRHASELLETMAVLDAASRRPPVPSVRTPFSQPTAGAAKYPRTFTTPFPGYAILNAVDILSASGSLDAARIGRTLLALQAGLAIVDQMAPFWATARSQRRAIRRRIDAMTNNIGNLADDDRAEPGLRSWAFLNPLENGSSCELDLVYPADELGGERLDAMGLDADGDLFVIEDARSGTTSDA